MLVGIVGGAIISRTVTRGEFLLFTLPILLPAAGVLLFDSHLERRVFALLILGFLFFTSVNVASWNRLLLKIKQQRDRLDTAHSELSEKSSQLKILRGLLPICAGCKKIRDDGGYWNQLEVYIDRHSEATFSHGLCPACLEAAMSELEKPPPSA